ncbi:hypothetical protein JR050_15835 [Bacillus sp. RD4P76]|uniref:Uncharacterized protein n=1 Tax=Bacillus suaedaesalsae TaxID=2810349 RepID=A0ABS2DKY9_9BACI|nr:hypothetical protein [Bacillus suaedaesalsae]
MLQKTCPSCQTNSYSSTNNGMWICPSCNRNITTVKTYQNSQKEMIQNQLLRFSHYKRII